MFLILNEILPFSLFFPFFKLGHLLSFNENYIILAIAYGVSFYLLVLAIR